MEVFLINIGYMIGFSFFVGNFAGIITVLTFVWNDPCGILTMNVFVVLLNLMLRTKIFLTIYTLLNKAPNCCWIIKETKVSLFAALLKSS
jgi:hypothetical protein